MKELQVKVYTPESVLRGPSGMIRDMVADLLAGRELAWRLAVRDIKAQYRQTFLGLLWAFIIPLANTAVWFFLNLSGVVDFSGTEMPYPVYVFIGTILWAIFSDAVNAPLQQVLSSRPMLAKLNFPREALIVSGVYQTLFNALIRMLLVLLVLPFCGVNMWHQGLLLLPLGLLSMILVGTSLGLLITPLGALYNDIGRAIPLLMQFAMFVTPVVFPMPKEGWALSLFMANPLTHILNTCRHWIAGWPVDNLILFLIVNIVAIMLLLLLWAVYRLAMPILIERMSA